MTKQHECSKPTACTHRPVFDIRAFGFWICFGFRISCFGFLLIGSATFASEPQILGYTEPYKIITLSASEPGVISAMLVEEGVRVKKDQVVAKLDTDVLEAELEIARTEAKLEASRKQRIEGLVGAAKATPDELEKATADLAIKTASVKRIEAQIENRTLRSPVDGIVTEIKRDPSEAVSLAQPHVLTVVQIDKLAVNLFLPPARAATLKAGAQATLQLSDPDVKTTATVEFVSPVIDSASGTVRVKFAIENAAAQHRAGTRCTLAE